MVPDRGLDPELVERRLRRMRELLDFLGARRPLTADELAADLATQLAVGKGLELLVEMAYAINSHVSIAGGGLPPDDYRSSFAAAASAGAISEELAERLAPSAGVRNVLVHEYLAVDFAQVSDALDEGVDDFRRYVEQVARYVRDRFQG